MKQPVISSVDKNYSTDFTIIMTYGRNTVIMKMSKIKIIVNDKIDEEITFEMILPQNEIKTC